MMLDGFSSDVGYIRVTGDIYPRKMFQEAKVHWLFQTLISLGKTKRSKAEGPREEERAWAIIYTKMIDIYLYTRASYIYRLCLICRGLKVGLSLGKLRALYSINAARKLRTTKCRCWADGPSLYYSTDHLREVHSPPSILKIDESVSKRIGK
jgi:hypothetical protein